MVAPPQGTAGAYGTDTLALSAYIYVSGGVYYGVDAETGSVVTSGSNFTTVANAVFAAYTGRILIKEGNYTIDTYLTPASNTWVFGEGYNTYLKVPNSTTNDVNHRTIFNLEDVDFIRLSGMRLDGNKANNAGLTDQRVVRITSQTGTHGNIEVDHCVVLNSRQFGVTVGSGDGDYVQLVDINNNVFIDNAWNHVQVENYAGGYTRWVRVHHNFCHGGSDIALNTAFSGARGGWTEYVEFSDNDIETLDGTDGSGNTHIGIKLESSRNCQVYNNRIVDATILISDDTGGGGHHQIIGNLGYCKDTTGTRGIVIFEDYNIIMGNRIYGSPGSDNTYGYLYMRNHNCKYNQVIGNICNDAGGGGSDTGIVEEAGGGCEYNWYIGNELHTLNTPVATLRTGSYVFPNQVLGLYQTDTGGWSSPTGTARDGDIVVMYNSTAGEYRIYARANSGWRYVALT